MAVSNVFNQGLIYDPYSDRQMLKEQYIKELQSLKQMNAQMMNAYSSSLGSQTSAAPIPQPEPYMNPVLLLLE